MDRRYQSIAVALALSSKYGWRHVESHHRLAIVTTTAAAATATTAVVIFV